jgi:ribonuclease I
MNSPLVAFLRTHKAKVVLAIAVLGTLLAWFSMREPVESPDARADKQQPSSAGKKPAARAPAAGASFDFYLLALTVHAAFCADGREDMSECRIASRRPLVIHGLWPEKLEPRTYPHDCPAPPLDLDAGLEQQLAELMPGMAAGLHEHEWREHGGCSGLDDDVYYQRTLELARALDAALGARLTTLAGRDTSAAELRETADMFHPGIGATFTLHCRTVRGSGERPVLIEVRQCIDNDAAGGAPGTLLDCAAVRRRDQGCGTSFRIVGMRG